MTIGSPRVPYKAFAKLFCRWDGRARLLRLGRLVWAKGRPGVSGGGYTAKLSLALTPSVLRFSRGLLGEWALVVLGVRLHYQRSYGGWIV